MAQLGLTVVGYVIGNAILPGLGGQIGAAVGSMAGAYLAAPDQAGPRLQDTKVQISSYGAMLTRIWGGVQVAGNVIWSTDLEEHASEQSAKGGPSITTFSYTVSFAVTVGEGPRSAGGVIAGIRRIWLDAKLVYDIREDADSTTQSQSQSFAQYFTFYNGSETQLPDPTIEAHEGVGNVEAYRGTSYVVFKDLPLESHGNRVPLVRFETTTFPATPVETTDLQPYMLYPWEVTALGPRHSNDGLMQFTVEDNTGNALSTHSDFDSAYAAMLAHSGGIATAYIGYWTSGSATGDSILDRFGATGGAQDEIIVEEGPRYCWLAYNVEQPDEIISDGIAPMLFELCSVLLTDAATPTDDIVRMASSSTDLGGNQGHAGLIRFAPGPTGPAEPGYDDRSNNCTTGYPAVGGYFPNAKLSQHFAIRVERLLTPIVASCQPGDPVALGIAELPSDSSFCISADGELSPNFTYVGVTGTYKQLQALVQDAGITGSYVAKRPLGPILASTDPNYSSSSFWTAAAAAAGVSGTYGVDFPVVVSQATSGTAEHATVEAGSALLSDVVTDICFDAGLAEDQIDVTELTDEVMGFSSGRVSTARSWIEPLRTCFWFDAVQSGDLIKFVKRGADAVVTIPYADMGAGLDDSVEPLTSDRAQETELPSEVLVTYPARSADYETGTQPSRRVTTGSQQQMIVEVPVVTTDEHAADIAAVVMYDSWTARPKRAFCLPPKYAYLEPTDVVVVPDGSGLLLTVRITNKSDEAGPIKFESNDVDAAAFDPNSVSGITSGGGATIRFDGPTNLQPLDTPLFRQADDGPIFYLAASGYAPGWRGGRAFRSIDAGTNYSPLVDLDRRAVIGFATTALGDWDGGNVVDEMNTVDITLHDGELDSITRAQLLNNGNAAVLGDEVFQFQTATFLSGRSYRLSGLLRGRLGTERNMGAHAVSERFVLVQPSGLFRVALNLSDRDVDSILKGVSIGQTLDDALERDFTWTAASLLPLSPVLLAVAPLSGGGYAAQWVRRTRYSDGAIPLGTEAPLGEVSERYRVRVLDSVDAVIEQQEVTSPEATLGLGSSDTALTSVGTLSQAAIYLAADGSDMVGLLLRSTGDNHAARFSASGLFIEQSPVTGNYNASACHGASNIYVLDNTLAPSGLSFTETNVHRIAYSDITTLATSKTAAVAGDYTGIAFDGSHLWIADTNNGELIKCDATTLATLNTFPLTTTGAIFGLFWTGGYLWVTTLGEELVQWDTGSEAEVDRCSLTGARAVSVVAGDGVVFALSSTALWWFDTYSAGLALLGTDTAIYTTGTAIGIARLGDFIIMPSLAHGTQFFDAATGANAGASSAPGDLVAGFRDADHVFISTTASGGLTTEYEFGGSIAASDLGGMTLEVCQISDTVGPGYPATITIP